MAKKKTDRSVVMRPLPVGPTPEATGDSERLVWQRAFRRALPGALATSLLLVGALVAFLWRSGAFLTERTAVEQGAPAPDFALYGQDGRLFRLADYAGRPVFLCFVPSWTDAKTIAEARSLAARREFDEAGAKVFLVGPDRVDEARALHEREKLPFPLLRDSRGELARRFGFAPNGRNSVVIKPKGTVEIVIDAAQLNVEGHGTQLVEVSGCCLSDVIAARAHGVGRMVGPYSLPEALSGHTLPVFDVRGDVPATVVVFLSAKCPCANAYNDRLAQLARTYQGRRVRVVGIYSNADEPAAEIAAHARRNRFPFAVFRDERGLGAAHFGAHVTPETFVFDARRVLRYAGRIDDNRDADRVRSHDVVDALEAVLAGKLPPKTDAPAFGCGIVRVAS